MMNKLFLFLAIMLLPLLAAAQQATEISKYKTAKGIWPFRINRTDKLGRYHGLWKVAGPDDKSILRRGRFRHGKEVGTWRYYYYPSGNLYMVEKRKRKQDYIQVQHFHENGALARYGQARVDETALDIRYYWYGTWKVFDEKGAYSHSEYFEKGNLMVLD
jgi:antitoxin component YwqK of YwqJK toxin-antitoxin module